MFQMDFSRVRALVILLACTTTFFGLTTIASNMWAARQLMKANSVLQYVIGERDACYNIMFGLKDEYDAQTEQIEEEETYQYELLDIKYKVLNLRPYIQARYLDQIIESIHTHSTANNLDSDLVIALIYHESRFDPWAVSPVGAIGLTQVMPFWERDLQFVESREDLFSIDTNIKAGINIYKQYLELYKGNTELALLAYNRGPSRINYDLRRGRNPSNGYEVAILKHYKKLESVTTIQ